MSKRNRELEDLPKAKVNKQNLRKLLGIYRFVLPYKGKLILGLLLLMSSSLGFLLFPGLIGKLVDTATGNPDWFVQEVNTIGWIMLGLLVLMSVLSFIRVNITAIVSERSIADIRKKLYEKLITSPLVFHEQRRSGELISRISNDVSQLQEMLSWSLQELLRQGILLIGGLLFIVFTNAKLSLVMLSTFPITILMAFFFGKFIRKLSKESQDHLAEAGTIVEETFQSIAAVKAFTNEIFEVGRYRKSIDKTVQLALKSAMYRAGLVSFIILGVFGGLIIVLWYGAHLISEGQLTIGALTSFIFLTGIIGASIGSLGDLYARLQRTIGASERIVELLDEETEIELERSPSALDVQGEIRFSNVGFAYPSRLDITILNDLNLSIPAGQKVALVGQSGSGKSTVAKLLMRFYPIEDGQITIDGQDIHQMNISDVRQMIGMVPQETILFGGTIRENIAYGKLDATEEEIIEAARKAYAMEFIEQFPEGLDTVVGDRGIKLSGGQKQRVAIARAVLKDPKILILDEATSALDAESEEIVQAALESLMKGRTTLIIAHRLSTIKEADQICVLENGIVKESGKHEVLIADEDGYYHRLLKLQMADRQIV